MTWRRLLDAWALHCVGWRGALLWVVRDATYPGMWRIRYPDGTLSDMANLSWAREGAIAVALRTLNRGSALANRRLGNAA